MSANSPVDGELLPAEAMILRLPKPPKGFNPDEWIPDWQNFVLSSDDKAHALEVKKPARISVWDHGRTTVPEARAFRDGPTLVLRLGVADVAEVASTSKRALSVVYEPLEAPKDALPGADGHAGIEGLDSPAKGESKVPWRAMIQDLAACAKLLEGPE